MATAGGSALASTAMKVLRMPRSFRMAFVRCGGPGWLVEDTPSGLRITRFVDGPPRPCVGRFDDAWLPEVELGSRVVVGDC